MYQIQDNWLNVLNNHNQRLAKYTQTLCFEWTTYDNINGPGGTIYVITVGQVRPLTYELKPNT